MRINVSPAFQNGFKGVTVFRHENGYQVSVKTGEGWRIGYGDTPQDGLDDALKVVSPQRSNRDDDLI